MNDEVYQLFAVVVVVYYWVLWVPIKACVWTWSPQKVDWLCSLLSNAGEIIHNSASTLSHVHFLQKAGRWSNLFIRLWEEREPQRRVFFFQRTEASLRFYITTQQLLKCQHTLRNTETRLAMLHPPASRKLIKHQTLTLKKCWCFSKQQLLQSTGVCLSDSIALVLAYSLRRPRQRVVLGDAHFFKLLLNRSIKRHLYCTSLDRALWSSWPSKGETKAGPLIAWWRCSCPQL